MRKVFFQNLENIARQNKDVFLLTGDLGVKFFYNFKNIDTARFINVGVAEPNMIGIASGLALSGKNVYCYSIIPFLTMRTFEQIRVDVCYNNLNVKLLGAGGGLVYGLEGVTHHAIEDIAIMRSLPNMTVIAPGDAKEAEALVKTSVSHQGPLYIRFGRDSDSIIHEEEIKFEIGKGIIVQEGKDICLMASGTMLYAAKTVCEILEKQGITPTLISMHTLKPLDQELVEKCGQEHKAIFTLEEHSIIGGLGSAAAEVLAEKGYKGIFHRFGVPDKFSIDFGIGKPDYLLGKMGLVPEKIAKIILDKIKNK